MLPIRDPPQNKRPTQTENEGLENMFQANRQGKEKNRVAILYETKQTSKQRP